MKCERRNRRRCWGALSCAWALSFTPTNVARADGENTLPAPPSALPAEARREVVVAVGYGSMIAPGGLTVYQITNTSERRNALDGITIDVTRRLPWLEYGARLWSMPATSDGRGSSAHALTRFETQARLYPWRFHTVEPWIGAEAGLALADDFAIWNKTENEEARRVVADVRPGFVAGLEVGARFHLTQLLALGARGGLLYLGFDRAPGPVAESPQTAKFFVQPTDYGERLWLSLALTAELTVPD
jgi:hypothetical protein